MAPSGSMNTFGQYVPNFTINCIGRVFTLVTPHRQYCHLMRHTPNSTFRHETNTIYNSLGDMDKNV